MVVKKTLFVALALMLLLAGVAGMILPIIPGIPLLLAASYLYGKVRVAV